MRQSGSNLYQRVLGEINEQFEEGVIDTRLVDPESFITADIKPGDTVVFALDGSPGPTWHCFTSTEFPRESQVTRLQHLKPEFYVPLAGLVEV